MKTVILVLAWLGTGVSLAHADGDAAKGQQTFKKCVVCHSIADKSNKVGPSLFGISGAKPGSAEGYSYSQAFAKYASGLPVWDDASLDAWIANPKAVVPGTKMAFAGLKTADERADLIAYLKTMK